MFGSVFMIHNLLFKCCLKLNQLLITSCNNLVTCNLSCNCGKKQEEEKMA